MFALPTEGIRTSVEKHNSDLMVAADWLELVLLGSGNKWSSPDVADVLAEGQIYRDQDFAAEFVESMVAELRRRAMSMDDGYPISFGGSGVFRRADVPHSGLLFCLLLSVGPRDSGWSTQFDGDYREQGELFELLMLNALQYWFSSWDVVRTGWGDGNEMPLATLVNVLATRMLEDPVAGWEEWVRDQGKDVGLVLAAVRTFTGDAGGLPVIMWQCASGQNWPTKLCTPDTKAWNRVLTLTHTPLRGRGTPVVIPLEEIKSRRNQAHGVLLDRPRLLPPRVESEWLDAGSAAAIGDWCEARLAWLSQRFPLGG